MAILTASMPDFCHQEKFSDDFDLLTLKMRESTVLPWEGVCTRVQNERSWAVDTLYLRIGKVMFLVTFLVLSMPEDLFRCKQSHEHD
jgi:hypothetical protein